MNVLNIDECFKLIKASIGFPITSIYQPNQINDKSSPKKWLKRLGDLHIPVNKENQRIRIQGNDQSSSSPKLVSGKFKQTWEFVQFTQIMGKSREFGNISTKTHNDSFRTAGLIKMLV